MALTNNFRDDVDKLMWRNLSGVSSAANNIAYDLICDLRNHADYKNDYLWYRLALNYFEKYFIPNDDFALTSTFTTVGGTLAVGAIGIFVPSHGPAGLCSNAGGAITTTSFTLAALPNAASVTVNQLGRSSDKAGYIIRIIDPNNGRTEEREIIANTAGTTPVVTLDRALTSAPTNASTKYEILSGRIYLLGAGTTAAGYWKAYDVATQSISGNLNVTNLPATIGTNSCAVALDEQYVPYDSNPGDGMILGAASYDAGSAWIKKCLTATAAGATSITGQAALGDATVLLNEYRNFQIRIVEDTGTPTAVGQRRKIISHTAGASPVYTVAAWTVTPSNNAKYVIEQNNDLLLWTGGNAVTYSYAAGGYAADANWSTAAAAGGATQYANVASTPGAGDMAVACFGIRPDTVKNTRHSYIYKWRGNGTVTLELFDIAAGANGVWTTPIVPDGQIQTLLTTGNCGVYDPATNYGRYYYFNVNATNRVMRFDLQSRTLEPFVYNRITQSTARAGQRMAFGLCDPDVASTTDDRARLKLGILYLMNSNLTVLSDLMLLR